MAIVTPGQIRSKNKKQDGESQKNQKKKNHKKTNYTDIFNPTKALKERRDKGGENVEVSQRKRSEQPGENVEVSQRKRRDKVTEKGTVSKERRDKGGENVEVSQRKRSEQPGENVEMNLPLKSVDPTLLVGTQRKVFSYLIQVSKNYASLDSPRLTLESISLATGLKSSQVHTATKELRKKLCIFIKSRKDGRGGWVIYSVSNPAFEKWNRLNNVQERRENVEVSQRKRSEQPGDKGGYDSHSSSYDFNLEKNTTTIVDNSLLKKCASIQIPSEVLQIGFKESHLKQVITDSSLNTDEIQESLDHYALDLRNGSVRAGFGKLNLIVGVLKKSNLYTSEAFIAEEQSMLTELSKRAELLNELKNKEKEIAMLKRYKSWKSELNQEEINDLIPPDQIIKEGGTLQDIKLQSYFEENLK